MKTYYIKTFGCASNYADSERIAKFYQKQGYEPTTDIKKANVVIINTCSVRESAENRVYGLLNNLRKAKEKSPDKQKIVLAGCILRYGVDKLKAKLPVVDEFLKTEDIGFHLEPVRQQREQALVPIMEGCNQFCTYCVVPYSRGRERSRPFEEIICEVERLVKEGCNEIILLGQNVNSYGNDIKDNKTTFANLLIKLNSLEGLDKISFLTSNPWDFTDEIISAIKLPKIDKNLHLPIQSGDNEILKRMNRPYTVEDYLHLVEKIRKEIPEIKIGTDIIVGFPQETEEQFENTVVLCKKVGFDKAYVARYSPRSGTVASRLDDDVKPAEKRRRWKILDELINGKHYGKE